MNLINQCGEGKWTLLTSVWSGGGPYSPVWGGKVDLINQCEARWTLFTTVWRGGEPY